MLQKEWFVNLNYNLDNRPSQRVLHIFQVRSRDLDISMAHNSYHATDLNIETDFIGPLKSFSFHFITAAPRKREEYFSMFMCFDQIVWACLLASAVAVSMALIFIDKMYVKWSNQPARKTALQSKNKVKNTSQNTSQE